MSILNAEEGFLFGCDPELFIKDADGVNISAHGLIPGTKEEPYKVKNGAVQVDGMAAEINIDPASSFEEFNGNIVSVLKQLKAMLPQGCGFDVRPSVRFSQEVMDAQPEAAKAMGCEPDYNAWTGETNPHPDTSADPLLRCAGGHLHFGWSEEDTPIADETHLGHCRDLVKQLDWFLGAWSVSIDSDVTRRQLYGKAGAFRPKPYGVEYRVLSNFWLTTKDRRLAVWNRAQCAIREMRRYNMPEKMPSSSPSICHYINTGEKGVAGIPKYPVITTDTFYARGI